MTVQKEPACARLPRELRDEIWKHYFAAVGIEYPKYHDLDDLERFKLPGWSDGSMRDRNGKLVQPGDIHMPTLRLRKPALLATCTQFRREAQPLYLQYLVQQKENQLGQHSEHMEKKKIPFGHWFVMKRWFDERREFNCRHTALALEIFRVQGELEKLEKSV